MGSSEGSSDIATERNLSEIAALLMARGFDPVLKDWDKEI